MIMEVIAVVAIFSALFYFLLTINDKRKLKKLRKKYNPDDDKSRPIERGGESFERGVSKTPITEPSATGQHQPERSELLPSTDVKSNGETGKSTGRDERINNLLDKLRARKEK